MERSSGHHIAHIPDKLGSEQRINICSQIPVNSRILFSPTVDEKTKRELDITADITRVMHN